jgi:Tfp pilus assembly protein PilV
MPPRSRPTNRRSGFALLVTIVLVAFLVLVLVGLASFTRVETQVASNSQQIAQARQNALMALNVALGKLQAAAGPDTRVTATADIVTGRDIGKKYWTGVWDASASGADKNIAWLVSGAAPAGASGVTSALSAADGNTLVELVGDSSTDTSSPVGDGNRVRVETQPIKSTGVPGFDPTDEVTVGNFGYWVGDEGVKAKVSLNDPWKRPPAADVEGSAAFASLLVATGASEADAGTFSFFGLQRTGIEGASAAGTNTATTDKIGGAYPILANPDFRAAQPRVLSLPQLPFTHTSAQGHATLNNAVKSRFHDLTATSRSLLTDAASGGLKRDLTAWLAAPDGPGNLPRDSDYILPPGYTLPADPAEH